MATESSVRSVWTMDEERHLQELQERKQRIMSERRNAVRSIAAAVHTHNITVDELTDDLIANAETLRDALAPFDRRSAS